VAPAEGVVSDHGSPDPEILLGPPQIIGIVVFVGVDEDYVKGSLRLQGLQNIDCLSDMNLVGYE